MENKNDLMLEFYRVLLDWFRKQSTQTVMLGAAIVFLYSLGTDQLVKLEGKILQQEAKIDEQTQEIRKCDMERAALEVEVRALKFQLENTFPNKFKFFRNDKERF